MPGTGSGDLYACALEFLTACYTALADTPAGQPDCYYISPGPAPWDVAALTVYASGPTLADTYPLVPMLAPGHRMFAAGQVNLISLTATILRCVPVIDDNGQLPEPGLIETAAQQTYADVWAIWCHLSRMKKQNTLFPPDTREMFWDPAVAVTTQGGLGGWQIPCRVQLDAYRPF